MTCHEFRDALEGALDARSGLPAAARHHAETCHNHDCRVALEDFRLIAVAVRSVPRVESPELVDRVMSALAPVRAPRPRSSEPVPRRAGSRSTVLSLITVAGVLVAAFLGLRPRPEPTQIVKTQVTQPTSGPSTPPAAVADSTNGSAPETEPFIPLHLAARAPALMTDTVNGHFGRTAMTGLPVVTPLLSAVTEQFRPMGQELKEWVEQFQTAPDKMMDSTQIGPPVRPIG